MQLAVHDVGNVALRRGIRAAIALPVAMALAMFLVDDQRGIIFTLFGTVGLLINADFAGSARQRLASYLATGAAGTLALVVGWAISPTTAMAVVVTMAVAFLLSFLNLLRGPIAVGTPAVLLVYVVAVSLDAGPGDLPAYLAGWWLAVAVSTVTALVVLPRNRRTDTRGDLADVFTAAARAAERVWLTDPATAPNVAFAALDQPVARLNGRFSGQPFRTWGLTRRDQSLTLLVDFANDLQFLLRNALVPRQVYLPAGTLPAARGLAQAIVDSLDELATAMRDPHHIPEVAPLDHARAELATALADWVVHESRAGTDPEAISEAVAGHHILRILGLTVEQMLQISRRSNGASEDESDDALPVPVLHRSTVIRSQLHLDSPWLRNSLRSALGLGLAVLVVQVTGVEKGFWVLLGVISILRFDAVGTRSFAWRAIAGTALGVLLASLILVLVDQDEWVLWALVPVLTFAAAWAAVAVGFTAGQTAFSMLILISLGIVNWPPQPSLAVIRIEDIALGAAVAVVVGVLLWPRGAVGQLRREVATSLRTAADYLATAIDLSLGSATTTELASSRTLAIECAKRAEETFDVSIMQRGPAEDLRPWTHAVTASLVLLSTGRVVSAMADRAPTLPQHPVLVEALQTARSELLAHWDAVADRAGDAASDPDAVEPRVPAGPVPPPRIVLDPIETTDDARALIVTVWSVDWVNHLNGLDPIPTRS